MNMTMRGARRLVIVVGVLLPYVVRVPRGAGWVAQYLNGLDSFLVINGFNAIAWGAILLAGIFYRRPSTLLYPAVPGFGLLASTHFMLDRNSDALASLAWVFFPVFALIPIAVGAAVGYVVERRAKRYEAA